MSVSIIVSAKPVGFVVRTKSIGPVVFAHSVSLVVRFVVLTEPAGLIVLRFVVFGFIVLADSIGLIILSIIGIKVAVWRFSRGKRPTRRTARREKL